MKSIILALFIVLTSNSIAAQIIQVDILPEGIVFPRLTSADRDALTAVQGQCIFNTETRTLQCYDGTNWVGGSTLSSSIQDADGDTKIDVDASSDEDVIRFDVGGTEVMTHDGQTLELKNIGQSVFIGESAGSVDDLSDNRNTFVGSRSGESNTSGTQNVGIGHQALKDNITGSSNVAIGLQALQKNTNSNNIAIGFNAARDNSSGNKNIAIGGFSGFVNQTGNQNTFLGYEAGRFTSTSTSGSVMIGHQAGMNEQSSDRLYIANDDTNMPLIYGEFDNQKVVANGMLETTGKLKVGNDSNESAAGMIRYNEFIQDFEGFDGVRWVSLTAQDELSFGKTVTFERNKIIESSGSNQNAFGQTVSIFGNHAIIGVPSDDDRGAQSGSAYIYRRSGSTWEEVVKLLPFDGDADDMFGSSVAITSNYAVVGAPFDEDNGFDSGSVYVFRRSGNTWIESRKLMPSFQASEAFFGRTVAIHGDYIAVGAPNGGGNDPEAGTVFIFKRNGSNWDQQANIIASDGATLDKFGTSISLFENDLVVGASDHGTVGMSTGAVYVYKRLGDIWTEESKIISSDGEDGDSFGGRVSLYDDILAVSATGDDDLANASGAVYVYRREGVDWIDESKLLGLEGDPFDFFGRSISIYDDIVVVGASGENDARGGAYVFKRNGRLWKPQLRLEASDRDVSDRFGSSVSIHGISIIIGAPGDDDNGDGSGAVYFY